MLQQNQILLAQKSLADISCQLTLCMQEQCMQISQIDNKNSKTLEKFQKTLEKLQLTVSKLDHFTYEPQPNMIELIQMQQYPYQIAMAEDLELPCYRNRIFSIKLNLVQHSKIVQNLNNIIVELQIWTYDKMPKKIIHNNHGQSIYKGSQQTAIKKGCGCLSKIQIKEVSSHFPKGVFRLVIFPVDDAGVQGDIKNEEIRKEWIKPLIISDVAIKAKKFSERHIPYFAKADGTIDTQ